MKTSVVPAKALPEVFLFCLEVFDTELLAMEVVNTLQRRRRTAHMSSLRVPRAAWRSPSQSAGPYS
jgi:hypothetical protein